ncbi:MAG TPA: Hpt domain-containing protein, partial [Gemmatimonadales bacterium]|nr:Hpt domain-containing protein [Gemmatimonadales bacterium]
MDLSKYAALFVAESRDHLKACNSSLLEWEAEPTATEPVGRLFRAVHTIKGMAATMGYAGVAQLAHRFENLLDGLRQGKLAPSPLIFQLSFRAVDTLGKAVEAAAVGTEEPADTQLMAELDALAGGQAIESMPIQPPEPQPPEAQVPARRATDAPRLRLVSITIRSGAVMRGARAALVLRRAEALGAVSGVRPPPAELERDEFDGRCFFKLQSRHSDAEIVSALRAVGELETVQLDQPAAPSPGPNTGTRQI